MMCHVTSFRILCTITYANYAEANLKLYMNFYFGPTLVYIHKLHLFTAMQRLSSYVYRHQIILANNCVRLVKPL